jgi:hypothetical protein
LKFLTSPKSAVNDVRVIAEDPLKRLYRHRNLVLHGGRTDAIALRSTLRVATPLVSAAMDRIAHAWYTDRTEPLRLAAIAEMRLDRLETAESPDVATILH